MGTDPYLAVVAELDLLARRVDALSGELRRLRGADAVGAAGTEGIPAAPPRPAPVPWAPAAQPARGRPGPWGVGGRAQAPADHGGGPRAPRRPRMSGARVLVWTGGGVTLLGVVLFLALAASRGWFGPVGRVACGAVLGAALIGVALRLQPRANARLGALALAGTGVATLYLTVAAAAAVYGFLAPAPALAPALAVAGGGVALADRWRAQSLACGAVVGAVTLAPVLVWGWLLVALALALQLAALPVVLRRSWSALALVAAAGPVLYGAAVGGLADEVARGPAVAVALGALVAGLATALPAARLLPARPVAALVAAAPVPALVTAAAGGGEGGAARPWRRPLRAPSPPSRRCREPRVRSGWWPSPRRRWRCSRPRSSRSRGRRPRSCCSARRSSPPCWRRSCGAGYGGIAVLLALATDAPLERLVHHPAAVDAPLGTATAVSALVVAFAVAALVAAVRVGLVRPDPGSAPLWAPLGVVGLYGAASLVVTLALVVSDDHAGFTAGHALVTVSWTVVALVLLAAGIRRPALRVAGMVLVGAAVAKLVLFDLVALDGLARVAAFLGAGLVLLAAGTRYARLVAEAGADAA